MKKIMVILLSFIVVAAMISVFSCSSSNPEEPQATNTPVPTATPIPTDTPTPVEYHFGTDFEGWTVTCCQSWDTEQALKSISWDSTHGHSANGCLAATTDFDAADSNKSKGNVQKTLDTYMDLTGKTISGWIYVPAEIASKASYNAQIYIKNDDQVGCDWCYSSGGWIDLSSEGWVQISANVDSFSGNADKTQVKFIGIQILKSNNILDPLYDVSGVDILFDDIIIQ